MYITLEHEKLKNISCNDFVNVNIALNSHCFEKKLEVYTGVQRKISTVCYSLSPLKEYTYL